MQRTRGFILVFFTVQKHAFRSTGDSKLGVWVNVLCTGIGSSRPLLSWAGIKWVDKMDNQRGTFRCEALDGDSHLNMWTWPRYTGVIFTREQTVRDLSWFNEARYESYHPQLGRSHTRRWCYVKTESSVLEAQRDIRAGPLCFYTASCVFRPALSVSTLK